MIDRRDYKNLIFKIFSFTINLVVSFFVSSLVVKKVGAEAYGFVGLANDFVSYAQIITVAINSMAARYFTIEYERKKTESANQYYSSLFFANLYLTIILSGIGMLLIVNLQYIVNISSNILLDVQVLWLFILMNFLLSLMGSVFGIATFCKKRLDLVAFREVIACLLRACLLVFCYMVLRSYIFYIGLGTLIATIYSFIYNILYSRKLMPEITINKSYYRKEKVLELVKSGSWNSFTKLGTIFASGLDLTITNLFIDASSMGIMSIAKIIPNHIYTFVNAAASAFSPSFILSYARNNTKQMIYDLKFTFRIFSIFTIIPLVLVISLAPNIFTLWVPSIDKNYLIILTIIASVGYLAVMPFESIWSIFTAANRIKGSSIYLMLESLANILVELILIRFAKKALGKMVIIVGVTSALFIIRSLFFFPIYTKKCTGESFGFIYTITLKNFTVCTLLSIFGIIISNIFSEYNFVSLVTSALIIIPVSLIACFFSIFNKTDRNKAYIFLRNTRIRRKP